MNRLKELLLALQTPLGPYLLLGLVFNCPINSVTTQGPFNMFLLDHISSSLQNPNMRSFSVWSIGHESAEFSSSVPHLECSRFYLN
jgi:hypothetical protein